MKLPKDAKYYALTDRFEFGQYKDLSIDEVLNKNHKYVAWCFGHVVHFLLNEDTLNKLADKFGSNSQVLHNGQTITVKNFLEYWNRGKQSDYDNSYRRSDGMYYPPFYVIERKQHKKDTDNADYERDDKQEREESRKLNREAFDDGDGTEYWSFENE